MWEPSVQCDRVGVEVATQIADLRSEGCLPLFQFRCHAGRQGEIEDVGSHLVRAPLPVHRVQGERGARGADGVEVPRGGEELVVDRTLVEEQRDLRLRKAVLQVLGRGKHASVPERQPKVLEVQSPLHSSSRTAWANSA